MCYLWMLVLCGVRVRAYVSACVGGRSYESSSKLRFMRTLSWTIPNEDPNRPSRSTHLLTYKYELKLFLHCLPMT